LANAPLVGQDGCEYSGDLQFGKPEYFFEEGLTRVSQIDPTGKSVARCHAPRKRGIQYAAASQFITAVSGTLNHPLSQVMTWSTGALSRSASLAVPAGT
jgi:hypothetical protein